MRFWRQWVSLGVLVLLMGIGDSDIVSSQEQCLTHVIMSEPMTGSVILDYKITSQNDLLIRSDVNADGAHELYRVPSGENQIIDLSPQLPFNANVMHDFVATPDRRYVLVRTEEAGGGTANIWRITSDGTSAVRLNPAARLSQYVVTFYLTPNGEMVLFTATFTKDRRYWWNLGLYSVPVEDGTPIFIAGSLKDSNADPGFLLMPDGEHIVYRLHQRSSVYPAIDVDYGLYQTTPNGDYHRPITRTMTAYDPEFANVPTYQMTADYIVSINYDPTFPYYFLQSVSLDDGSVRSLANDVQSFGNNNQFVLSPDGQHVYYIASYQGGQWGIYSVSLSNGEELLFGEAVNIDCMWERRCPPMQISPDGDWMIYPKTVADDPQLFELVAQPIAGGEAISITAGETLLSVHGVQFVDDGRRLVYFFPRRDETERYNLYSFNFEDQQLTLISDTVVGQVNSEVLEPILGGQSILYVDDYDDVINGTFALIQVDVDGTNSQVITDSLWLPHVIRVQASGDGSTIVYREWKPITQQVDFVRRQCFVRP